MYSRNYGSRRFSPPPGYVGSAFSETEVKHHVPPTEEPEPCEANEIIPLEPTYVKPCEREERAEGKSAFEELIRSLRGRIGTEEILILLVLLLTASDGIGIETIILAVVLLAGGKNGGECSK